MAIVDYRGFRLIATSSLPISSAVPEISPDSMFETQQQIQLQIQKQIDLEMHAINDQAPPTSSSPPLSPTMAPPSPYLVNPINLPTSPAALDISGSETPETPMTPTSPPTPPTPRNVIFERPEELPQPGNLPTEHPKTLLSGPPSTPLPDTPSAPLSYPQTPSSPSSRHNNQGTSLLDTFNNLSLIPSPTDSTENTENSTPTPKKKVKQKDKDREKREREEEEGEIPAHTLVYGSCDGGNTVYNSDPVMHDLIKQAAAILNLKVFSFFLPILVLPLLLVLPPPSPSLL